MSLHCAWVDRIFDKLSLTYGQAFLRRWQDLDLNAVKSDWGHELAGFDKHPQAIAYALQNLPAERPPTVLEFRAIARRAPSPGVTQLPRPAADPARVAAELAKLEPVRRRGEVDRLDWARRIVASHESGAMVSRHSLGLARAALHFEPRGAA
jgi:hypothetical protein